MSTDDNNGGNRTVFRPSPLQGLKPGGDAAPPPPPAGGGFGGYAPPPPVARSAAPPIPPQPSAPSAAAQMARDDIPQPSTTQATRNRMMAAAGPVLALAASFRTGRARMTLPQFHGRAHAAIAGFDQAIAPHYPEEMRQRAKYAMCATIDDIAQNMPGTGTDGAEWARRSMVVSFFQENIGGDRFWQLVQDMIANPRQNADLIELYHACLAAGFEGRFRVMPDGKRRLFEVMQQLYGALEHHRSLSQAELVQHWKGEQAPLRKVGLWSYVALAAAIAAGVLLLVYIVLRLVLMQSGQASMQAIAALNPPQRLTLSRNGAPPPAPPASSQVEGLAAFLAPEIKQGLVKVEQDASTVRVRTTVGQLFRSGSDQLEPGRQSLFERIGAAIEKEKGQVTIEGHSDSDKVSSVAFPDNMALSEARANAVSSIVKGQLSDGSRVQVKAFGDTQPIASNDTAEGKALNRRVEIVVPRRD
jgi:type VI secretion system protein ImpK